MKLRAQFIAKLLAFIFWLSLALPVFAQDAPFDLAQFQNLTRIMDKDVVNSFVKTVGLLSMDRPYQAASPLGRESSWELGLQVTMVKLNDEFKQKLKDINGPALEIPAVPMGYLQLQKGLGENANIGVSYFKYKIFRAIGGHLQVTVLKPEEAPLWALRLTYSSAQVGFVNATTWAPQLVTSRPLDFAEPYLGVGLAYNTGGYKIEIPQLGVNESVRGSAVSGFAFTGVKFKVPAIGLKLGVEGAFSSAGAHSMGLATGLVF